MDGPAENRNVWWIPSVLSGKRKRVPLPAPVSYTHLDVYKRQDWDFDEQVEIAVEDFLSLPITAEPEPISLELLALISHK